MCKLGDPSVGLIYGSSGPQVHRSASRPTHNSQLFWWRGRQFRSQWQRRYVVLFVPLPLSSTRSHHQFCAGRCVIDGNVYIWHRDRAILLDVLPGHGSGSVNSVAWNPRNPQMFASCSDDFTIHLWEPSGSGADAESSSGLARRTTYEQSHESGKGKGKSREPWVEDDPAP
jgi:WD40 repeat protein